MKKFLYWLLAIIITLAAAYYQRKTGPTYPKITTVSVNGKEYKLRLVRSLSRSERPEVMLSVNDTSLTAKIYYRRFLSKEDFQSGDFSFHTYPIHSAFMNKVLKIYEEKGFFAEVPKQPAAGKIEYYFEITDGTGTRTYMKETPVVIRFKDDVPGYILGPHVIIMFLAMLFSTLAGLMAVGKISAYRKYSVWTLVLLIAGGLFLGMLVQRYAFGAYWTGIPFGWDLTDNKTLIALVFWFLAVVMNRKTERPAYVIVAAIILLIIYSIPHSLFGSQLNYQSGNVTQGIIFSLFR